MRHPSNVSLPWARIARKTLLTGASAALALSLMPATALASVNVNDDGYVTYTLPTAPMSIQQQKTDANGNTYTQEYLSVCLAQPPMNQPYFSLLGINNTALGRTIVSGGNTETQYGLFGSDANVCPDTYLYNYCAYLNGATVASDAMLMSASNMTVTIDGTEYNMPRDVYMETNLLRATGSDAETGGHTYAEWVALENQREGRTKTGTYNPAYVSISNNSGSAATMTASLYALADTCDEIIENSKDANGNYTLATRYAEGPNTHSVVHNYEDIVKGTQYYLLSKIASGEVEKATVAVVCGYDPDTGNYAVRKVNADFEGNYDSNLYAGRFSSAICAISNDLTELGLETAQDAYVGTRDESTYVAWYTPEQIVENADAVLVTDAPSSNRVSTYLATASNGSATTAYTNMDGLEKAKAAAEANGGHAADLCYHWPASLFGVYYAQGCENVVLSLVGECFLYPEVFDLTDIMAWWAKNVWHITDAALQDIVDSTCYDVSLSYNQSQIHTISADFEERIDNAINAGNAYYLKNYGYIDSICDGVIATYDRDELKARTLSISAIGDSYTYTGSAIEPTVTVSAGEANLTPGVDYDITYSDNVNVGTATITITGKGSYAGIERTGEFNIVAASIEGAAVTPTSITTPYTGSALQPAVTVTLGGTRLSAADYDVAYSDNVNVGTATITVTGKGNYTGTATGSFAITEASYDMSGVTFANKTVTYNGTAQSLQVGGSLPEGVSVSYSGNERTNAGTYVVTATFTGDANHKAIGSVYAVLTINKAANPLSAKAKKASFKVKKKKAQTTAITVKKAQGKVTYKSNKAKVKVSAKGKVTIKKGFKGTAKITVKAAGNGNYKAASKTITIKVKK